MITLNPNNLFDYNFDTIEVDPFWNTGDQHEHLMHRIHAYPAKFPAFIATKAIEYAHKENIKTLKIADIFCGCGTVAFESMVSGIEFWGCDINPVAILIARVKSKGKYRIAQLMQYFEQIRTTVPTITDDMIIPYHNANKRFAYWFDEEHYKDLAKLKLAIEMETPERSDYRLFFYCGFSNILKATSRWLTKSIKPQVDPRKQVADTMTVFSLQIKSMISACNSIPSVHFGKTNVVQMDFLDCNQKLPKVDIIITSPPYVTSYEYADLHQLSSLWLGYADDYRSLRKGSIGSLTQDFQFRKKLRWLNSTGKSIVSELMVNIPEKARDVAKYYWDMQHVAKRSYQMLNTSGLAVFVIGNTAYKGVHVDNAKHLAESLFNAGFSVVSVTKRKISKKNLTPYRDENGRFSSDDRGRKVYSEEYILIGRK